MGVVHTCIVDLSAYEFFLFSAKNHVIAILLAVFEFTIWQYVSPFGFFIL